MLPTPKNYNIWPTVACVGKETEFVIAPTERAFALFEDVEYKLRIIAVNSDNDYYKPVSDKLYFREDLNGKIDITRSLAREFADYYIPLDGIMAKACVGEDMYHWSADGVHPNDNGSEFIGRVYADAINEMLK